MKVAVLGLGYVGFTTLCCISHDGYAVVGFDINEEKVQQIKRGIAPIVEPRVDEMLKVGLSKSSIEVHTEIAGRLDDCDLALVCVGTPSSLEGSHDMSHIAEVTRQIARTVEHRSRPLTVVYRSTMRPGSMDMLVSGIFESILGRSWTDVIELAYNPEFLRESSAVEDYYAPSRIVIGTSNGRSNESLDALYEKIDAPRFYTQFNEAELTKFVDNTWHATKVAFGNEIGRICGELGVSSQTVFDIFASDDKLNISTHYLRPGGPFGGSCLPKDVRALQHLSGELSARTVLIDSLMVSNESHTEWILKKSTEGLAPGSRILQVGVAFKGGTDDLRESPGVVLAQGILEAGYQLSIFDPSVKIERLVAANLGYAYSQLSELESLLVSQAQAESGEFDRILITNSSSNLLDLGTDQEIVNVHELA